MQKVTQLVKYSNQDALAAVQLQSQCFRILNHTPSHGPLLFSPTISDSSSFLSWGSSGSTGAAHTPSCYVLHHISPALHSVQSSPALRCQEGVVCVVWVGESQYIGYTEHKTHKE